MSVPTTLVWFRQDLRTDDQPALQAAARSGRPLLGLYVWPNEGMLTARRRYFIWQSLRDLQARLAECGIPLHVREGNPVQAVAETAAHCRAAEVVCASDGAGQGALRAALEKQGCRLHSVADGLLQPPFQFIRAPYFNELQSIDNQTITDFKTNCRLISHREMLPFASNHLLICTISSRFLTQIAVPSASSCNA